LVASHPARSLCAQAFPHRVVIGWTPATVGALREYHFSGPVPHVPLKDAFAGVSGTHRAAWCILRDAPDSSSLWGVVSGRHPQRALRVTGPGEGRYRGPIDHPPVVP
jgi:hypothetical protein